jgi:predicted nuclease of predicted toxin-antitoxin system
MRILLDEDLDVRLRNHFSSEHEAITVRYRGWTGMKNGELLGKASQEFDVFVTMDNNLPEQQDLSRFEIAVFVLRPRSQDLDDLAELVPEIERLLPDLRRGRAVRVHPPRQSPPTGGRS